ncbi:lipid-binding SYLF domain-containing protein [Massilia brevitalea]|uniref:lipid-binding SYLF domain-containing protein n=1 Tax=Massilia brevitalea TaxID=442526 RepID=UPI002739F5C5|nr:lipid-binding SYLF domain-containing protein [Massilia brevitalea]
MKTMHKKLIQMAVVAICAGAAGAVAAAGAPAKADTTSAAVKQGAAASQHVTDAIAVVGKIEAEGRLHAVLGNAKGIFIVPSYGRAALGVGAAGGTGILLVRRAEGGWSDPVFYKTGGLSVGLQAGAAGGAMALILNNDKAVSEFLKKNNFSINAKAGLTVVNWNKMVQGSAGTGDVLAWSDTKGLFGDVATLEFNDIRYNQAMTNAYYQRSLSASDVIDGKTGNPQAGPLVQALVAAAAPIR